MLTKLTWLLTLISFSLACHHSAAPPSVEIGLRFASVKITRPGGDKAQIPLRNGLTIVNLFDEFSSGCPTGNRFETMERLNSLTPAGTILLIFSEKNFSTQDMDNFRAILPMSDSLVQGDIEAIRPNLTQGKLLVVLDFKGRMVWHEKPEMSEQQVFTEVSELLPTASKISR